MVDPRDSDAPAEDRSDGPSAHEEQLHSVMAQFLDAVAVGEVPDRRQLLADHADLADELQQFLRDHDRLQQMAAPWLSECAASDPLGNHPQDATPPGSDLPTIAYVNGAAAPSTGGSEQCPDPPVVERFADYELLEEIGRGGMGVVHRARQVSLKRIVAVKMVSSDRWCTEADAQRLRAEAESVASLQHPCIVKTYEVGEHGGRHFFSMEYVDGQTLSDLIREDCISPRRAARYAQQIAEAIEHAHQNGVLHRDLKPSNVLIDAADRVRVTDFGLAKRFEAGVDLTLSKHVVGTLSYMAPEQAGGKRGKLGPASDVYSMGAMLYEMLTGRPPFQADTHLEILDKVHDEAPLRPRRLNSQIPRDLEKICLKCIEKDPGRRYTSARALAEDLERFIQGDAISINDLGLLDDIVRTLERGHHDVEFRTWSRILFHFAWIAFLAHFVVFLIPRVDLSYISIQFQVVRLVEFTAMGFVLWIYRSVWYPPRGGPSRQLWSLWLGYVAGSTVLTLVGHILAGGYFDDLTVYPQLAVLSGLGYIMMGGSYWGYFYLMGAAFLILALLMSFCPPLAPLVFGIVWATCFIVVGLHLRRLADEG